MKRVLILFVICVCSGGVFRLGYITGKTKALGLQRLPLGVGISALDDIKEGDIANAEKTLRNLCYASANCLLDSLYWKNDYGVSLLTLNLWQLTQCAPSDNETVSEKMFKSRMEQKFKNEGSKELLH